MRITSINLQNFKRFTDLAVEGIPEGAKLVLLIGANGSGKSSVFEALDFLAKGGQKGFSPEFATEYYSKDATNPPLITVNFSDGVKIEKNGWESPQTEAGHLKKLIGRSSIRIVPRLSNQANSKAIADDLDSPKLYIENDARFVNDVSAYIQEVNRAVREPIFSGKTADTLQIFRDFIEPLNSSLLRILGGDEQTTIQIAEFEDSTPQSAAKLIFKKGHSKINYDLLSHGEKQVVILLLNFIVRQEQYRDSIIFIDEMDCHLNTALQSRLLREIVERWVPDDAQLWTATHALGFIEYAKQSEQSAILDFDMLDFDHAQMIRPSDKTRYEVFEIAVSKEFLDDVFQGNQVVFSENTDTPLYNNLAIRGTLFFKAQDKLGVFQQAKNLNKHGLIDRDYLSDNEVRELQRVYPWLKILPYYSIENLLYHPDNLAEYFDARSTPFDKTAYIQELARVKNAERDYINLGLAKARDGYPFFKENEHAQLLKIFRGNATEILDLLRSDDFETFYPVFPAKDYGTTIGVRQNLNRTLLAKTNWFLQQVSDALR